MKLAQGLQMPHKRLMIDLPVILSKSVYTSLAARYWDQRLSPQENAHRYGNQASAEGLGGNWRIEASGPCEKRLDSALARLKKMVDHRRLFTDLPEFAARPATLENVTVHLAQAIEGEGLSALTIHESDHLSCTHGPAGLELNFRVMNLNLFIRGRVDEYGLMTSREPLTQAAIEILKESQIAEAASEEEWARTLLGKFRSRVGGLYALRVDLGSKRYIVVS